MLRRLSNICHKSLCQTSSILNLEVLGVLDSKRHPCNAEGVRHGSRKPASFLDTVVNVGRVPKRLRKNRHRRFDDGIYLYFKELEEACLARRKKGLKSIHISEWNQGVKMTLDNVESLTPFRMANVLNCFKRAKYVDEPFFDALVGFAIRNRDFVSNFDPVQLSMTIQSLAMLARDARHNQLEGMSENSFTKGDSKFFTANCVHFSKVLAQTAVDNGLLSRVEFTTRELSSLVHALGLFSSDKDLEPDKALRAIVAGVVDEFCEKAAPGQIKECKAQDYSNLLHGCLHIGFRDPEVLGKIFERMKQSLAKEESLFSSQCIGNIMWALGEIGVRDEVLLKALVGRAMWGTEWRPRSISDVALGLGLLDYYDGELLTRLARFVSTGHMVMSFTDRDLANTIFGFGLLGFSNWDATVCMAEEMTRKGRVSRFTHKDLARFVVGLGLLGYDQEREIRHLAKEIVLPDRLWGFRDEDLASIVHAFGAMKFFDPEVYGHLIKEISQRMREMALVDLAKAVAGFTLARSSGGDALSNSMKGFFRNLADEIEFRSTHAWDGASIAAICRLFSEFRIRDDGAMKTLAAQITKVRQKGKEVDVEHMVGVFTGCVEANAPMCEEFVQLSVDFLMENLDAITGVENVTKAMFSMAAVGKLTGAHLDRFCAKLGSLGMASLGKTFDTRSWERVLYSGLYVRNVVKEIEGISTRTQRLMDRAEKVLKSSKSGQKTEMEVEVAKVLNRRGVAHVFRGEVLDGSIRAGFLIEGTPGRVILCDDFSSFAVDNSTGKMVPMGQIVLRNRILEVNGYKGLSVPSNLTNINEMIERFLSS
ncbi:hypothetical protein BSKO_12122 [Bryopsis sp. KO-2023]|nr:hypothetical protein BSKO_12122 [Bryopsis sp. KO-2023]